MSPPADRPTVTLAGPGDGAAAARSAALVAEIARVRHLLERRAAGEASAPSGAEPASRPTGGPLEDLAARFGLSGYERDVVALAAAVELDGEVARLVAEAQGGDPRPSPALAMSLLGDAHWDAFAPTGPLRWWRLVHLEPGASMVSRPCRLDERILHHLTGVPAIDEALAGIAAPDHGEAHVGATQAEVAKDLAATVASMDAPVVVTLDGDDPDGRLGVARTVVASLGAVPLQVRLAALPGPGAELERLARLVDRESVLGGLLPVLRGEPERPGTTAALVELLAVPVVVRLGGPPAPEVADRVPLVRSVDLPGPTELRDLWAAALGPMAADAEVVEAVDVVAHGHRVPAATVEAIAAELRAMEAPPSVASGRLRELCAHRTHRGLDGMAERIEPTARWQHLVLPEAQMAQLRALAAQARHRDRVYREWGFDGPGGRSQGVTALFAGDSGTGKTLAAEVVAGEVGLALYRIDLASVVSKYIGETEKNLRRVFEAAERSGAVLLFDEGDALFGRRSEVRDSHDRYANIEVAYLLGRMESYRGLAILTTNLRANVDRAFLRRLRFVIDFPFPDEAHRARIWQSALPPAAPTEGLDPTALARLNLSGGGIRSVAVAAAFAAAEEGSPITPAHVLQAAERESAKAQRTLTSTERAALS
jgi:vesicle-fusing ATPase